MASHPLADKMLSKITADDIRGIYTAQLKYSLRQAVYEMQVMRAVLLAQVIIDNRWARHVVATGSFWLQRRATPRRSRPKGSVPGGEPLALHPPRSRPTTTASNC
jgi:hypothetical protein